MQELGEIDQRRPIELQPVEYPPVPESRPVERWGLNSWIAVIVLVIGIVQLCFGALRVGVTYDEPFHVSRTKNWLSTGWFLPDEFVTEDGQPNPDDPRADTHVYGPAFSILAHSVNVILGNEGPSDVSSSREAYTVRHFVSAAVGLLGVLAVALIVWTLSGSRVFGLWAAAGLLAVPAWTGQSFFSVKDVPAASGYTMLTAGLVLACCDGPGRLTSLKGKIAIACLVAGGVALGVGARPSFLIPFACSFALFGFLRFARSRVDSWRGDGGAAFSVVMGCAIGLILVAMMYVRGIEQPWNFLVGSLFEAADYSHHTVTLTAGQLLSERPPGWYLPAWIFGSYPIALMALAILGLFAATLGSGRRTGGTSGWKTIWKRREVAVSFVLVQAFLVLGGAAARGAVMYQGIRQHIYIVPAIAVLAGLGAHTAWRWASAHKPFAGWLKPIMVITFAFALGSPMIDQLRLFPYNYVYLNEIAGMGGVSARWETDYYLASSAEALSHVPRGVEVLCSDRLVRSWLPNEPDYTRCNGRLWRAIAEVRGTDVSPYADQWPDETWVLGRNRGGNKPPDFCIPFQNVVRSLRGEDVLMSYVLRCDAEALRAVMQASTASREAP